MKTITFPIVGMHCASCVVLNEDSLKKVPGVIEASVNFPLQQATVTFDEAQVGEPDLHQAVRRAGYSVPRSQMLQGGTDHAGHLTSAIAPAKRRAIAALLVAGPVVIWVCLILLLARFLVASTYQAGSLPF